MLKEKKVLFILIFLLSGCSYFGPVKGYEGPELAPSQISWVLFMSGTGGNYVEEKVKIDSYEVDKREGIHILPGHHNFTMKFTALSESTSCGLKFCSVGTLGVSCSQTCQVWEREVNCSGAFDSLAQRKYNLQIEDQGASSYRFPGTDVVVRGGVPHKDGFQKNYQTVVNFMEEADWLHRNKIAQCTLGTPAKKSRTFYY